MLVVVRRVLVVMLTRWLGISQVILVLAMTVLVAIICRMLPDGWRGGLVALLAIVCVVLGSVGTLSLFSAYRARQSRRYRLAWLSARRRAIYTRVDLEASQQVIETVREARSHWSPN